MPDDDPPDIRRRVIGFIGAGTAVLALAVAVFVFGTGGEEPLPTSLPPSTAADDGFFDFVGVPANITMIKTTDSVVVVSWDRVDGAGFYEVVRRDAAAGDSRPTRADEPSLELDLGDTANPCLEVVAIGESGRISQPSEIVCLE